LTPSLADATLRLSDVLIDAGRPVAYYPRLRAITGSTTATLLLCQLIYWSGKQQDRAGWIMKRCRLVQDDPAGTEHPSNQSIEYETGLTYREQDTARRLLRARGLIRERQDRLQHRVYFQVDFETLRKALQATAAGQASKCRSPNTQRSFRETPDGTSLNGTYIDYTETTAERTAASLESASPAHVQPEADERLPTTPSEALRDPHILLFQEVCGRIPGTRDYKVVIEMMRHFSKLEGQEAVDYLRPFWLAWSTRRRRFDGKPYDPGALTWLTEWAVNGSIPPEYGGLDGRQQQGQEARKALSAEDIAAAGRINRRRDQTGVPKMQ